MKTGTDQRRSFHRLGAFGMTAVLTVAGGGALLQKCAPAPPPPPAAGQVLQVSSQVVALVNTYRAQAGLAPLAENAQLDKSAQDHSADQAQRQTMTHTGWNGSNAGQRMVANGYSPRMWGENVAYGFSTPTAVMTAWMNSSGHRANILNSAFNEIGVSAVTGSNGLVYWTMDLGSR